MTPTYWPTHDVWVTDDPRLPDWYLARPDPHILPGWHYVPGLPADDSEPGAVEAAADALRAWADGGEGE